MVIQGCGLRSISLCSGLFSQTAKYLRVSDVIREKISSPFSTKIDEIRQSIVKESRGLVLIQELDRTIGGNFPKHPFSHLISSRNAKRMMARYLAMSQAFPYIQASAYKDLILYFIDNNESVPETVEKTFVVGSFLCWDETGSHHLLQREGVQAFPQILNTGVYFHSNLLKQDLRRIFRCTIIPEYCSETKRYLVELMDALGSANRLKRTAAMVAFEMHAAKMIEALWASLVGIYKLKKEDLSYFQTHVGGDDPGEAYHVALTQTLVGDLVRSHEQDDFIQFAVQNYKMNVEWCERICQIEGRSSC